MPYKSDLLRLSQGRVGAAMAYFEVNLGLSAVSLVEASSQTVSERGLSAVSLAAHRAEANIKKIKEWRGRNDPTHDVVRWRVSTSLLTQNCRVLAAARETRAVILAALREARNGQYSIFDTGLVDLDQTETGANDEIPF